MANVAPTRKTSCALAVLVHREIKEYRRALSWDLLVQSSPRGLCRRGACLVIQSAITNQNNPRSVISCCRISVCLDSIIHNGESARRSADFLAAAIRTVKPRYKDANWDPLVSDAETRDSFFRNRKMVEKACNFMIASILLDQFR
jgi:hypothetical protein